jgi:prophage maintenance system killer protein
VILYEITGVEEDPTYQKMEIANGNRQYDFLRSVVVAALETKRPFLSQTVLKALNFQAIACLHTNAGEYRPCAVSVGEYTPPEHFRVAALMEDFTNNVNRNWESTDPVVLACFVLWRINYIHPFINGNGRTARAACYFVLCLKLGGWLPGEVILPELIRRNRTDYVAALRLVDESAVAGKLDLAPLHTLISRLLEDQLKSAGVTMNGDGPSDAPEARKGV